MVRIFVLLVMVLVLSACSKASTDCANVARWIELGIQTHDLSPDGTDDAAYAAAIEERNAIKAKLSDHDLRFAETFQTQLNDPGRDSYAPIYAVCRKWETGEY